MNEIKKDMKKILEKYKIKTLIGSDWMNDVFEENVIFEKDFDNVINEIFECMNKKNFDEIIDIHEHYKIAIQHKQRK